VLYSEVSTIYCKGVGLNAQGSVPTDGNVLPQPTCSATDETSGIDAQGCIVSGYSTQLGVHTLNATAADNAGNRGTETITYEVVESPVDDTPPNIELNLDGTLGNNGWYTRDVHISWTVTDPESAITATNGCDTTTITEDTTGIELTCEATSEGGTSSESLTIRIDATPPVITAIHSDISNGDSFAVERGVPGEPTCEATDDVSGIDGECEVSGYGRTVGEYTLTFTARDNAGNESPPETLSYEVVG